MPRTSVATSRPEPEESASNILEPLIRLAGDIAASRALIVANHGLDLLCALVNRGCPAATASRPDGKTDAKSCELLLIPLATEFSSLEHLVGLARRTLLPGGRLIVGIPAGAGNHGTPALIRRLKLQGFAALRSVRLPGLTLLLAELQGRMVSVH